MLKKIIIIYFLLFSFFVFAIDNPKEPDDPNITGEENKIDVKYNVEYQKQNTFFTKGYVKEFSGFYLNNLTWKGNENGDQKILIDFIKSIRIKGYTTKKTTKDKLSFVFYFPYVFDIELKNGTVIEDAVGKIKEIESFYSFSDYGKEKCYTYFMRFWLEDKMEFLHNGSKDFNESPDIPKETIIFLDFIDN